MKTQIDFDECEGKVIDRIVLSWVSGGTLVTYADGTYSYFIPYIGMEDKGFEDIEIGEFDFPDKVLVDVGLYTDSLLKEMRELRRKDREAEQMEKDIKEYERLKAKLSSISL